MSERLSQRFSKLSWGLCFLILTMPVAYGQRVGTTVSEADVPKMIKKIQDGVVNIQTDRSYRLTYRWKDTFLHQFSKDFFESKEVLEQKVKCTSEGTGVIIDSSGLILTNEHVVSNAQEIKVILNNKKQLMARLVGKNKKEDLALLAVEAQEPLFTIPQGNSDESYPGEDVFAIGTPYGYSQTVTKGVVSAINRQLKDGDKVLYDNLIQTDAAINPGNSGGPLLNSKGEVVGIIRMEDWRAQNIGFAIPINKVKNLLPELKTPKKLDLELQKFEERFGFLPKESADSDGQTYLAVAEILAKSKAMKIGISLEDRLQKFGNMPVNNLEGLLELAGKVHPKERVYFEFNRQKRTYFTYIEVNS